MLDYGTIRQELEKYPALTLPVVRKIIIDIREAKLPDPKVMGNAGSFFMNPIVPREKAGSFTAGISGNTLLRTAGRTGEDSRRLDDRSVRVERESLRSGGCTR